MAHLNVAIVKHVGNNGQISLGKKYAGKQVSITEMNDGTIVLKPGKFIPDSEVWLYANNGEHRIDKAIIWHETTSRRDNYDEIMELIQDA